MIVAVKEGERDPANNSRLAAVVTKAKRQHAQRQHQGTIEKALGAGNSDSIESNTYEGYDPARGPSSWRP